MSEAQVKRTSSEWIWIALPLLSVWVFWWGWARYGFNPTDDGFILSQSWRIVAGEVPHVDFTSPRPLGSALMHVPEVLAPWGLLALDRLIVVLQLLWICTVAIGLVCGERGFPHPARGLLIVAAFLLSAGAWPIMAWHTIDGLFVGLTALWLAKRPTVPDWMQRLRWPAVWLLAGFAPLVKQGFALVPIAVLLIALTRRDQAGRWVALPFVVVPGLLYLVWVGGEIGMLREQLYAGSSGELFVPLQRLRDIVVMPKGLITVTVALCVTVMAVVPKVPIAIKGLTIPLLLTAPVVWFGHDEVFGIAGDWSYLCVMALLVVSTLVRDPTVLSAVAALLVLTYASCMSWGVTAPSLMAGAVLGAAILLALQRSGPEDVGFPHRTVGVALALVAIAATVLPARSMNIYREPARSSLTSAVDSPQFALIRMSPQSASYVDSIRDCVARYPATEVAVLPDGPGLYPLLGLRSPFHMDWWLSAEQPPDAPARMAETVATLNATSDWLVLAQSFSVDSLSARPIEAMREPAGGPIPPMPAVLSSLDGQNVTCYSFIGKYRPAQ